MRASASTAFQNYTAKHEGATAFMYADILNLVTTGFGNLIDAGPGNAQIQPTDSSQSAFNKAAAQRAALNTNESPAAYAPALALTWYIRGPNWQAGKPLSPDIGRPATTEEVIEAWKTVKRQNAAVPGFAAKGGAAYASLTNVTLSAEGMKSIYDRAFRGFEGSLKNLLPNYDQAPAPAQFAAMSMAWAMGVNGVSKFKNFISAFSREDYKTASAESKFNGGDYSGRNKDNKALLLEADEIVKGGLDRDSLRYFR